MTADFDSLTAGLMVNSDSADKKEKEEETTEKVKIENPFETKIETPQPVITKPKPKILSNTNNTTFFSTQDFQKELRTKSIKKNKAYQLYSENIGAYDIASGCIRSVYYRIKNIPTNNYADKWTPVLLRTTLGSAVHDFIQDNCGTFTEQEVCLKVPSRRLSCRLDCLINDNVLVEIKSCPHSDLQDIIKTDKPRTKDFYQAVLYKYLLENHLEEAKQQAPTRGGSTALLDNYNIEYMQFIYVAHDLISSDTDSMSEAIKHSKNLKKLCKAKSNPYWFMQTITVDLKTINIPLYESIINRKINETVKYISGDKIPEMDHEFIDKGACFFCIHSQVCKEQG